MTDVKVHPDRLRGIVKPPPSKSDGHRALIAAFLAGDAAAVQGLDEPLSQDLAATRNAMRQLLAAPRSQEVTLDCHESGSTLRFLIPLVAALGQKAVFIGRGRLPQRPLAEYQNVLQPRGVNLSFPQGGKAYLPLRLSGRLRPGRFEIAGDISSQYLTGLLLALPLLDGDSQLDLTTPLASAPYVDMTLAVLKQFGIQVKAQEGGFFIPGWQRYHPCRYTVERDHSQAAFWLTARYLGCKITVSDLREDSVQGDRAIGRHLTDLVQNRRSLTIDAGPTPDLVPILAVAAAAAEGETKVVNAARLRHKESDRLAAVAANLAAIGVQAKETSDGLIIQGQKSRRWPGGQVQGFGDHRIVMAFAVAALFSQDGVVIRGAQAVGKSYPDFFDEWIRLGGRIDELDVGQ